ncbi:hypothetical protein DOQ08_02760 [Marinobacter litoralis]|uniref:Uncharacterized protein n=1 Tax=Marinobacter litoralis TaxID=187981 RepID=A0A3M2R9Q1_9GAMM|nr:hypothetical protein DOQ08_02760 [Marinobacter litoralis]
MVGQWYFPVNTGYYGMTPDTTTITDDSVPCDFLYSATLQGNQRAGTRQRSQFASW